VPTSYPGGFDAYGVPSLPEETPLSSAGDSTRAHTPLLRDLGDGLEAVQHNAALKGHDHSGDADDIGKGDKLSQDNTHEDVDTDSPGGIHHSLGEAHEQAAYGDHIHDYNNAARLLNRPYVLCTSTTRPAMPDRGMQIYETDTDRVRVWASFGSTEAAVGLRDSIDNYDSGVSSSLPPAVWDVTYDTADLSHGTMGTPNGQQLSWTDASPDSNRAIARRIKTEDKETVTDDQVLTWKNGPQQLEGVVFLTVPAANDKYFRMSADGQSYIRLAMSYDFITIAYTTTGRTNEKILISTGLTVNWANASYRAELKDRTLSIYYMGELLFTFVDRNEVTDKGPSFRGWGTGMTAGARFTGQSTPGSEDWIRIQDSLFYQTHNRWTVLPVAKIPTVRLRQTTTQSLAYNGTIIQWGEELEDEFDFFNPVTNTDIVIKEPGLYNIQAAIQWDPSIVPDTAMAILCVNGLETNIRKQQFMRGAVFTPGFSQTLDLSGQLRFNTNDVFTVKVKYVASPNLLEWIFSWFDGASKISSRLDMHYIRV